MATILGLRTYLLGLIVVAVLPVLAFAGVMVWSAGNEQVRQRSAGLVTTAQLMATAIDRELFGMLALLEVLAQAPSLQEGDLAEFHQHALLAARPRQTVISLQTQGGTQVMNTHMPFGDPVPDGADQAARAQTFASGQPAINDLFVSSVLLRPMVAVAVPATGAGGARYMLDMVIDPALLSALMARFVIEPEDVATLLDGTGRTIARSVEHAAAVGRDAPSWQRSFMAGLSSGLLRGRAADGTEVVIGFARPNQAPGWSVMVSRPARLIDGAWYQPLTRLAAIGVAVLLIALALAALLARAILRPVLALTARFQALSAGEASAIAADTDIREFHALARATEAAETAQRERANTERTKAIEAAREDANAIFRAFAEATPDVVWIVELATGRLAYLGPAYEGIWGDARDAVLNDLGHWRDSVHPDDRAAFAQSLAAIADGQTVDVVYRITRPDGAVRWIRDLGFPLRDADGTITRAAGIARDVTAGKDTEHRLRISDTRCTGLIGALGTLVWWSDADGRMVEQRGKPVDAGQLPREPGDDDWRTLVHPDDRPALEQCWQDARAKGEPWNATFRVAWPGEAPRWHLCRAAPMRDQDGTIIEWAGVLLDIERPPEDDMAAACSTG